MSYAHDSHSTMRIPDDKLKEIRDRVRDILQSVPTDEAADYDVFISYRRAESSTEAEELAEYLSRGRHPRSKKALRVFHDTTSIPKGVDVSQNLTSAIAQSSVFIPILTETYSQSDYTKFESQLFSSRDPELVRDRILPILLDAVQVPPRLDGINYYDFALTKRLPSSRSEPPRPAAQASASKPVGDRPSINTILSALRTFREYASAILIPVLILGAYVVICGGVVWLTALTLASQVQVKPEGVYSVSSVAWHLMWAALITSAPFSLLLGVGTFVYCTSSRTNGHEARVWEMRSFWFLFFAFDVIVLLAVSGNLGNLTFEVCEVIFGKGVSGPTTILGLEVGFLPAAIAAPVIDLYARRAESGRR